MKKKLLEKYLIARATHPFFKMVAVAGDADCWLWTGSVDKDGYGVFSHWRAHRHMARLMRMGDIEGKMVLHNCDNPTCCNPRHLRVGSHEDNMLDRSARNRTAAGPTNGRAKLTFEKVREIRASTGTVREIAKKYGMNYGTIADIRARRTWRGIE